MRALAFLLPLAVATGCASTPCVSYLDAQQTCYDTLDARNPDAEKNAYCRDFSTDSDPYFTCLADAYSGADCTTDDGLTEAIVAAAACSQESAR